MYPHHARARAHVEKGENNQHEILVFLWDGVKFKINLVLACVAVSPNNFRLCALRERDSDGPNLVALRSNSMAAARFLNSTTQAKCYKLN